MKKKIYHFNLIEIVLTVAVIAFGVVIILGMLPKGLRAARNAGIESFATDVIDQMCNYMTYNTSARNDLTTSASASDFPDLKDFLRIWTRKEALVKWQGEGLSRLHLADTVAAPNDYGISFFEFRAEDIFITLCASAKATVSNEICFLTNEEIEGWKTERP